MAKNAFVIVLILLGWTFAQAQFDIPEINKVKEIRPLESDTFEVQRLLVGFETDGWDPEDYEQRFTTENYSINITYSSGRCEDEDEIWKAAEWKVVRIEIEPEDTLKIKDLGFDFSKFMKEQIYAGQPELVIYHDKKRGMAFEVNEKEGEVETIILFPSKESKVSPCDSEKAKQFLKYDSWFGGKKLKDRVYPQEAGPPSVTDLILSANELTNLSANKQIQVKTVAVDPEYDVLTYQYIVSGGKIVGKGAEVIWDLSNLLPGIYTITAGVDDGCGICGKTQTKSVTIK